MAKRNLGEKIKLTSYNDMFGLDTFSPGDQKLDGQIINIPLRLFLPSAFLNPRYFTEGRRELRISERRA